MGGTQGWEFSLSDSDTPGLERAAEVGNREEIVSSVLTNWWDCQKGWNELKFEEDFVTYGTREI